MKKQFLVHSFNITATDQRRHFQINLPRNAKRITGVHHSIVLTTDAHTAVTENKSGLFYRPTIVTGDIRLFAFERSGWFYAGEVTTHDRNVHWGDPSILGTFFPEVSTHSLQNFSPVSVLVDAGSTVVSGYYFDRWAKFIGETILYKVIIWLEVELENSSV